MISYPCLIFKHKSVCKHLPLGNFLIKPLMQVNK